MIKSMTGYGKEISSNERFEMEIELRSVNSRYFDLKIYMPRELNYLENEIRTILAEKIKRGKIDLKIRIKDYSPPQLELDKDRLKAYWDIFNEAAEHVSYKGEITLERILNEKGIINIKDEPENAELKDFLINILNNVIEKHQEISYKEGNSMMVYLEQAVKDCKRSLKIIEKLVPDYRDELLNKLKTGIEELIKEQLSDNEMKRLMVEVSLYIEKADITEEVVRLNDHFEKFVDLLHSDKPEKGKSLNFILQEMHREINTIGSKFNHIKTYDNILLIKEEIEKCREIVQNVE